MHSTINWVDGLILGVIILSALISLFRGFVKEVLSLASWILAGLGAFAFAHPLSEKFLISFIQSPTVRIVVAFSAIFLIILISCTIISYLISQLIEKTGLSGTDRVLGMVFGCARGVLVIGALLLGANLTPMPQEQWWKESALIPYFRPVELWLKDVLPKTVSARLELLKKADN